MPTVFISFATEDLDFVIKLYSRFKRLGVEAWNYSNRGEEIALGQAILPALAARIDTSNFFLPVVSADSVQVSKMCIQYEVSYAVEKRKPCFPLVIAERNPQAWAGSFEQIRLCKGLIIPLGNEKIFEEKICELCDSLGVAYQPDNPDYSRLPFFEKFLQEVKLKFHRPNDPKWLSVHERLLSQLNKFNLLYALGEWKKSLKAITYFLDFRSEEEYPADLYYPHIIKGACELELGLVKEAEVTFSEAAQRQDADENAFGGLGHVYLKEGKIREALEHYQLALKVCPPDKDHAIIYSLVLIAVEVLQNSHSEADASLVCMASDILTNAGYLQKLENTPGTSREEKLKINYLIGLMHLLTGHYWEACNKLESIYKNKLFVLPADKWLPEFNAAVVSSSLQAIFKEEGFFLAAGTQVSTSATHWIIKNSEFVYRIDRAGELLEVYHRGLSLIIYYADALEKTRSAYQATHMLMEEAIVLNETMLFQHCASLLFRMGRVMEAKRIYEQYLCIEPHGKQYQEDYALLLQWLQNQRNHC